MVEPEFIGFITEMKKNKGIIKRTYLIILTIIYGGKTGRTVI